MMGWIRQFLAHARQFLKLEHLVEDTSLADFRFADVRPYKKWIETSERAWAERACTYDESFFSHAKVGVLDDMASRYRRGDIVKTLNNLALRSIASGYETRAVTPRLRWLGEDRPPERLCAYCGTYSTWEPPYKCQSCGAPLKG